MSTLQQGVNRFTWTYSNYSSPSTTPGTSVTPGASNVEGSWTQLVSSANCANDVWGLMIWVSGGNTSTAAKNHLLDIGTDPAGGTSYTARISNIVCGQSASAVAGGQWFYFPYYIKAGSTIAARIQGSNSTAGTVRVGIKLYGKPSNPHLVRVGRWVDTIGSITNSNGVSFTPGNSGAEGSWTQLTASTARRYWYWELGVQIDNGTTTSLMYNIDLAYGDATNKHFIFQDYPLFLPGTAEATATPLVNPFDAFADVPAGQAIYIRGSCSGTAVTGFNALAYGVGG